MLLLVALVLLSTVTVFDPQYITDKVLLPIIGEPEPIKYVQPPPVGPEFKRIVSNITADEIFQHFQHLTALPTRCVGYDEELDQAHDYVMSQFRAMGFREVPTSALDYQNLDKLGGPAVWSEEFPVVVPVDKGASIEMGSSGQRLPMYCVWPNQVKPPTLPPKGVTGHLLFGGQGKFWELNGEVVKDSIVLMDFACGQNYVNPRMLGARAIIFCDLGKMTTGKTSLSRGEASEKVLKVPVDIPRFYVEEEVAWKLLEGLTGKPQSELLDVFRREKGIGREFRDLARARPEEKRQVSLWAKMVWEKHTARNIYAWLPGLDQDMEAPGKEEAKKWKDQIVVVESYYDSISVVPKLAPGAENACGITALLATAKALKEWGPHYSVMFLASSAHFQYLSGVSDFLYRHARKSDYFLKRMPLKHQLDPSIFIGLDLSSQSAQVAAFSEGVFNNSSWGTNNYQKNALAPYAKTFKKYIREVWPGEPEAEWSTAYPPKGMTGTDFLTSGEAGGRAPRYINAITPPKRSWKDYMPIPIGLDHEMVTLVGLQGISLVTPHDIRRMVDTPADTLDRVNVDNVVKQARTVAALLMKGTRDYNFLVRSKLNLQDQGHTLKGSIRWFDRNLSPYIPEGPVEDAIVTYQQPGGNSCAGVRTLVVTKVELTADRGGRHRTLFQFDLKRNRWTNTINAYKLDDAGNIVMAPDLGQEGAKSYPIEIRHSWWEEEMIEVLFPCRAISIFETVDSRRLSTLDSLTILGPDNAVPQRYGTSFIANQSALEGKTTAAAVAFVDRDLPVKLFMSTGLLGIKYLLTNAPEELLTDSVKPADLTEEIKRKSYGIGFGPEETIIFSPSYQGARDMWIVDDVRMKELERFGIRNDKLSRVEVRNGEEVRTGLHEEAKQALLAAKAHLEKRNYEAFVASARRGWGLEARGYPDVKGTANDTVRGIIFYFMLVLPFSFFCERLFCGCVDIRNRVFWFSVFFVGVFLILTRVHPAFKLSSSSYVIFLAFVILTLGAIVLIIVMNKFSLEIKKSKRAATGLHEVDVGRISATLAAVLLGISNLRRRKVRTTLTAITLVLLTFTVLSFTSIKTALTFYQLPRDNAPIYDLEVPGSSEVLRQMGYEGMLVRDRSWRGMQLSALDYIRSAFEQKGSGEEDAEQVTATVVPRAWFLSRVKGERQHIQVENLRTSKISFVYGLVGMVPDETVVSQVRRALLGLSSEEEQKKQWARIAEKDVVFVPDEMAEHLGLSLEDVGKAKIKLWGQELLVVGLLDTEVLNGIRDLDDEAITPVDFVSEMDKATKGEQTDPNIAAVQPIQSFIHLNAGNALFLPYDFVIDNDGYLASIAVAEFKGGRTRDLETEDFFSAVKGFMARVALTAFVGYGDKVTVYSSIGGTSLSGTAMLLVIVVIASLIVLNTMIGAVYERSREIGIYSSVGLTPKHIAALFLAEASVFATLGAVTGYLMGQVIALLLAKTEGLSAMNFNYSSLSAIWSTVIVMLATFLSTLYPARVAANMAVPDVSRKWAFPEPEGDDWHFDFPFTVGGTEALGMYAYLARVFRSYGESSIGAFVTENVELLTTDYEGEPCYTINMMIWLAPYDLGISQKVTLKAIPTGEFGIYKIEVDLHRESGDVASWRRINRGFLNLLRKRFLVWRTLDQGLKHQYHQEGAKALALEEAA